MKEPKKPVLLYAQKENTSIIHYDAYTNGEIYVLTETEGIISLQKIPLENEEIIMIENIYFKEDEKFLEDLRSQEHIEYRPFTNSPQSTLFVGKPTEFLISKETQTIIFKTDYASYLYDTNENKYILINPYKTEILSFSPDNEKIAFLCLESEKLGFFIFEKEISNYSIQLGGKYLANYINKELCSDFGWHQNSQNIYYICENSLYVTDIKAEYNLNIIEDFGEDILLENNNKVLTIVQQEDSFEIINFEIN